MDLERLDDAHRAYNTGNDEGRRTQKLSYGKTARIGTHGGESGEYVWAAVSKCEESNPSYVFIEAEELG